VTTEVAVIWVARAATIQKTGIFVLIAVRRSNNSWETSMGRLLIALMMEAVQTCETLVNLYQPTRRYNPEESIFQRKIGFLYNM
jgi:hypothetical protein